LYLHWQRTMTVARQSEGWYTKEIRKTYMSKLQCIQKVAVHLQKLLEVMSMSLYPFNFIHKHFLQICVWKVYKLHSDEVQVFLGIFQQITPALNRCIYCLLKRCNQQEKHVPQLKEP
jgi:hypothetical protein